jgi:hypothetical protein
MQWMFLGFVLGLVLGWVLQSQTAKQWELLYQAQKVKAKRSASQYQLAKTAMVLERQKVKELRLALGLVQE